MSACPRVSDKMALNAVCSKAPLRLLVIAAGCCNTLLGCNEFFSVWNSVEGEVDKLVHIVEKVKDMPQLMN